MNAYIYYDIWEFLKIIKNDVAHDNQFLISSTSKILFELFLIWYITKV